MGSCRSIISVYVLYVACRVQGHRFHKFLVSRGLVQVRQPGQYQHQVFIRLNTIGFSRLYQRVQNGTGFCSPDAVEQPGLSACYK